MALVLKDRVKETSTTAGTGTITLAGAVAGFQSFSAVGNGNTTYYAIVDPTTGDWEVGIGTYTSSGTTLSRDTVLSSSNSGSLVNFVANQKDVFVTYPSEKSVYEDASNVVNATSFGAITATSAALTTGTVSTAPASGTDIANKTYVDTLVSSGITYHTPVKYEVPNTTGNLNATYNQPGGPGVGVGATLTNAGTLVAFTPDGTVATAGDRIIIYNQTNQFENGIYTVTTVGSGSVAWVLTRATDADTYALKSPNGLGNGDAFFITSGATGAGETYVCNTAGTITFGTTAITFAQISDSTLYTAGTGLTLTGTEFSITPTGTAGTYGSASSVPVLTTNASGQVTSVTNTTIAINGSQVSGNISGSAGSVANALTLGTYLTGTSFNGSAAVTATVDATSANTASKVVARDSSGNFSAGTITATLNGTATSTASATNLSGGAANQIAYQSAANTTAFATAPSASNQVLNWNGSAFTWSAGTISGIPLGSNLNSLTAGTYLTGTAYNGSAAQTWAVDATSANTASKVVARDASGDFSAGTITASLSGNATSATNSTTTSQRAFSGDISTTGQGRFTGWYSGNAATGFAVEAGISGGEGYVIAYDRTTSTYGALNIQTSSASLRLSGSTVNVSTGALQQGGSQVLTAANYNSYAPTLTGTGASGTWNINVTGSAGSATSITNFTATTSGSGFNPDSPPTIDQIGYWSGGHTLYGIADGGLYTSGYSTSWYHQISGDFRSGQIAVRGKNNGTWQSWYYIPTYSLNNGYSTGSLYAGIYYDANNTGYYVDPASSSNMYEVYANNWFRTYGVTGLYSQSYASHFYPDSNGRYWSITGNGSTDYGGLLFKINYESTIKGYVYWDANGFGLLHGGGGWSVRGNLGAVGGQFYGSWFSDTDLRAPIFYDYNDTGYYVDPASTSNTALRMRGGALFGPNVSWGQYLYVGTDGNVDVNTATVAVTNGNLHLDARNGYVIYLNNYATSSYTVASQSIRSPIFYDYNDTTYYVDPNSVSSQNSILIGYNSASPYVYAIPSTGYITFGTTSDTTNYAIKTEMESYNGSYSKLRFKWYTGIQHYADNYYGGHRFYDIDGTEYFGIGVGSGANWSYSIYSHRAPIFYDLDNTGYYLDPSSGSYLYSLSLSGNAYFQPNSWIQFNGNYGIYSTAYNGAHFLANAQSSYGAWRMIGSRNSYAGIYDDYSGVTTGMFDSAGNGGFYREANGRWYQYHNVSNNCTGFGTSTTASGYDIYCGTGIYSGGRVDGTIFYDSNNTSYYCDPSSTNSFNTTYTNVLYSYGNVTAYYSSDIKFKTNVRDIPNAIETVESIGGKLFDWTDEYLEEHGGEDPYFMRKEDFGVVAQDVLKVFPVAVRTRPDGSLAVDYEKLSALAFAAVAELSTRVKSLEARI